MPSALAALGAVALVALAAARLAATLLPRDDRPTRAAAALVLGAAIVCAAYGALNQLGTRTTADVELVFFGDRDAAPRSSLSAGAGEVRVRDERVTFARATPRNLALVALALAAASLALRPRRAPRHRRAPAIAYLPLVPLGLVAFAAVRSAARGYDALWYHLPLAASFMQTGHLEPPGRDLVFYFPGNVELLARTLGDLLGAWALPLVQLPFALALGPLATALARRVGAGRAAWVAGALALGCPMVIFQAGLAYSDVVALAALAAALVFLLDAANASAPLPPALAAGACLGLLLGAKYSALPLLACGLPIATFCACGTADERRLRLRHLGRALGIALMVGAASLAPAWFWYARNLRLTGNPFFPIALPSLGLRGLYLPEAFNREKELELVADRSDWLTYPFTEGMSHEEGFGALFAALVPIASAVLLGLAVRALVRRRRARFLLPLGWGLAYVAAWWWGTPHEVRHLLPIVVLLGAPAALLLRGTSPRARGLRLVATAAIAVVVAVVVRVQLFSPVPELSARPQPFDRLYDAPGFAEALARLPRGARVANLAGRPYGFALLGPRAELGLYDYAPARPTESALTDRGATHVFFRGSVAEHDALRAGSHPLRLAVVWSVATEPGRWSFWGGTRGDLVTLYQRLEVGESVGDR